MATTPVDAAVGDFNGDGFPDVAIANQDSNNVSIRLGNPDGTFGAPTLFPTGTSPVHIIAADFNKDNKIDLVTANLGDGLTGNVSLLLGDGHGNFQAPTSFTFGTLPADVAVGDFDKDTNLDLAVADSAGGAVVVRLGNGNGTFDPPITINLPQPIFLQSLVVDDMNGDTKLDIVTPGVILLGDGSGGFPDVIDFRAGLGGGQLVVRTGDVNGDTKPDVVVTSGGSHMVTVLLGNGDGTLQSPRHYVTGNTPTEVAIVDLDGDGKIDLLVSNAQDNHLSMFFGNGDGTFHGAPAYLTNPNLSTGIGGFDAAVADFTGDNIPDVVAANGGELALLTGLGGGAFGPPAAIAGLDGNRVIAGDWNHDNKQDLAFTNGGNPSKLKVALGNGQGGFGTPTSITLPGPDQFPDFLTSALVNNDNVPDLLVANTGANNVSVFLGDGNGAFNPASQPTLTVGIFPNGIATGDFNNDQKLDLAISNRGSFIAPFTGSLQFALGNGDGTFQTPVTLHGNVKADSVVVADFDGKNGPDIAAVVEGPEFDWEIEVYLNNGNGTFPQTPLKLGVTQDLVQNLRVSDFDHDGIPDLAVSLEGTKGALYRGKGDGTFEAPLIVDLGGGTIVAADLDQDSLPDIVAPNSIGVMAVLINISDQQPTGPDLAVSALSGPATALLKGKVALSYTIQNQGNANAGAFNVNFYLSSDNVITSQDTLLASGKSLKNGLAGGASSGPTALSITLPKTMAPGSYFIGAIADPANLVSETDESNNTKSFPITVCAPMTTPALLSPAKKATGVSTTPTLDWSDVSGASSYEVQVATDSKFTSIVRSPTGLGASSWMVSPALGSGATLFWRVRAVSPCGAGSFSKALSFTTN